MAERDRLATLMAEQAGVARDVEARELLASVRRRMFARADPPLALGRYRDLERIGVGGMGIVYSAHDPDLDRTVALKVLRPTRLVGDDDVLEEARILARTSHPNIVPVLDVGRHGDEAFIAMERVEGHTLQRWLSEERRGWQRVVEVLVDAGRGLAAAHAHGVVHRDFKPSNMIIGADGRVRVMDFGLALQLSRHSTVGSERESEPTDEPPTSRHGGTLGYAAPEQVRGSASVDARADQFSLGACLYEALAGTLPFPSTSAAQFTDSLSRPAAPLRGAFPRTVAAVVMRALAVNPEHRHPDMSSLVDALELAARAPRRRRAIAWATAFGAGVLAAGAFAWRALEDSPDRCPAGREVIALWDDAARERTTEAFEATALPYASTSAALLDRTVATTVQDWSRRYEQVCRAGPAGPSDPRFDAQLACFDEHRTRLSTLVELFGRADETTVEHAVVSVLSLPNLDECETPDLRRTPATLDPEDRVEFEELRRRIATTETLITAGAYDDAQQALGEPPTAEYEQRDPRTSAEHASMAGRVARLRGEIALAKEHLERAHPMAVSASDDRHAALIAADLLVVVGVDLGQPEQGEQWRRHAEAALERSGAAGIDLATVQTSMAVLYRARGDLREAERRLEWARHALEASGRTNEHAMSNVLTTLGAVLHDDGRYDEGLDVLERALELLERTLGPEHPRIVATLIDLGITQQARGDSKASVQAYVRALQIARRSLGPRHLQTAVILNSLGNAAVLQGDDARAREHFERALDIFTERIGPEHPTTVTPLVNLGAVHGRAGEHDVQRRYLEHALEVLRTVKGPDDPTVAQLLVNLGSAEQTTGDAQSARTRYLEAKEIFERRLGADHPHVAVVLVNLGTLAQDAGDAEAACRWMEHALAIREAAFGPEHPSVAYTLVSYAIALTDMGELDRAQGHLRRALELHRNHDEPPWRVADARLALAEVSWARGDRDAAHAVVETAIADCSADIPAVAEKRATLQQWQRTHPLGPG